MKAPRLIHLLYAAFAVACGSSAAGTNGGNTSWLERCAEDAECESGVCGNEQCQEPCSDDEDCSAVGACRCEAGQCLSGGCETSPGDDNPDSPDNPNNPGDDNPASPGDDNPDNDSSEPQDAAPTDRETEPPGQDCVISVQGSMRMYEHGTTTFVSDAGGCAECTCDDGTLTCSGTPCPQQEPSGDECNGDVCEAGLTCAQVRCDEPKMCLPAPPPFCDAYAGLYCDCDDATGLVQECLPAYGVAHTGPCESDAPCPGKSNFELALREARKCVKDVSCEAVFVEDNYQCGVPVSATSLTSLVAVYQAWGEEGSTDAPCALETGCDAPERQRIPRCIDQVCDWVYLDASLGERCDPTVGCVDGSVCAVASCGQPGVCVVAEQGACDGDLEPVCACDGQTYANRCMAGQNAIAHEGDCGGSCFSPLQNLELAYDQGTGVVGCPCTSGTDPPVCLTAEGRTPFVALECLDDQWVAVDNEACIAELQP